jgi:hypothetical protein
VAAAPWLLPQFGKVELERRKSAIPLPQFGKVELKCANTSYSTFAPTPPLRIIGILRQK